MLQNDYTGLTELENSTIWMPSDMSADTVTSEEDALDQAAFEKGLLNQGKLSIIDDDFHHGLTRYSGSRSRELSPGPLTDNNNSS